MFKRIGSVALVIVLVFTMLIGCNRDDGPLVLPERDYQTSSVYPNDVIMTFFDKIGEGDIHTAFSCVYVPEKALVTIADFKWYIYKEGYENLVDSDWRYKSSEIDTKGIVREATVELINLNTRETLEMEVEAVLNENNRWQVQPIDFLVYDWEISAPMSSYLSIDGKGIAEYKTSSNGTFDYYTIPAICPREKKINLTTGFGVFEEKVVPEKSKSAFEIKPLLKNDMLDTALLKTKSILNSFNKLMNAGANVAELKDYIAITANPLDFGVPYLDGVELRKHYRNATVRNVIQNVDEPSYIMSYDTVMLNVGISVDYEELVDGEYKLHSMNKYVWIQMSITPEYGYRIVACDEQIFNTLNDKKQDFI